MTQSAGIHIHVAVIVMTKSTHLIYNSQFFHTALKLSSDSVSWNTYACKGFEMVGELNLDPSFYGFILTLVVL